jgi:uncharacterized spore protein YtfJ
MSEKYNEIIMTGIQNWEKGTALVEKLFTAAQPSAVYGEPVTAGDYTVITASEVKVGMGFGYGAGGGSAPEGEKAGDQPQGEGAGGGGGGGGASGSRPVAVVSIGPDGVKVEPVVDVTKIGLAFITAVGSMFFTLKKMRQASHDWS